MAADPIEDYVLALDRRLAGSRAAKRDLLTEARDSLLDAAEAYAAAGLDRRRARLRAVTEFGALDRIAPEYQSELAVGPLAASPSSWPPYRPRRWPSAT